MGAIPFFGKERPMPTVHDIIAAKGPKVWSVTPETTVFDAVRLMTAQHIGGVVVLDGDQFVGMFTERDLMRRVVAEQRDPAREPVRNVMTIEMVTCHPAMSIEEARAVMRDRRVRHLPMTDGAGRMLGLVSIGDLNAHMLVEQEQTIGVLQDYLYGRS